MVKVALLIGVSEYEHGLTPLPAAVRDVDTIEEVLQNRAIGNFDQVTKLVNPPGQTMAEAIENLFNNREKDDLILLYFSGHGIKDERGKLYFATSNTRKNDQGALVKATSVPASFVHEVISNSRSKREVVILDCCFSGAFAEGMSAKGDDFVDVKNQLGGEGRAILTSSTSTQYSFQDTGGNTSTYTAYIVEGLETGAADKDENGWITVDELHEYAARKVQEVTPAMKPEIYAVKEGYKIKLAAAPNQDPDLKYRREVEYWAEAGNGEISDMGRQTLREEKNNLQITDERANEIETQVLAPIKTYKEKLHRYELMLIEKMQTEFPLSDKSIANLKRFQQALGLKDEAAAQIYNQNSQKYIVKETKILLPKSDIFKYILLVIIGAVIGYMIRHMNTDTVISVTPPKPNPLDQVDDSLPNPAVLTIDGTVTIITLIKELRDRYNIVNPNVRTTYGLPDGKPNGSNAGLGNLLSEKVLMAASSRGLNVVEVPIALDAVAVTVGINNPYKGGLTKEQLRSIFLGKITNWSQVGGPNLPIKVINRSPDSGTHSFFKEVVLDGQSFPPDGPNFNTVTRDETIPILRALGNNGIGYSSVTQIENQSSLRVVPIDGISPIDRNNIKNGTYPLSRSVYLVVPRKTSQAVKKFVEFALSPKGQAAVEREGFIPIE